MKLKCFITLVFCWLLISGCSKGNLSVGSKASDSINPTSHTNEKTEEENTQPLNEDDTKTEEENTQPLNEDDTKTEEEGTQPLNEDDTKTEEENTQPLNEDDTKTEEENTQPLNEDDTKTEEENTQPLNEDDNNTLFYQFSLTQASHTNKGIDILMVIDNSNSMESNHQGLGSRFNDLFNETLKTVDWQMAFLSSDPAYASNLPCNNPGSHNCGGFYYLKDSSGKLYARTYIKSYT